jgi:hypothetical protein
MNGKSRILELSADNGPLASAIRREAAFCACPVESPGVEEVLQIAHGSRL